MVENPPEPADNWIDFLRWLVSEKLYDGDHIADVVEKPWQYGDEYAEYQAAGGVQRDG